MKKLLFAIFFLTYSANIRAYDIKYGNLYYDVNAQNKTARVTRGDNNIASYSGKVVIPSSIMFKGVALKVTSIGVSAFSDCTGLTSITIPNSVTSIWYKAFSGCTGLTSITIPNSVTYIDEFAFYRCTGLTSITIPNSVTHIDKFAFDGCTGLTSIKILNSVKQIGLHAFANCKQLKKIYLYFESVPECEENIFYNSFIEFATLYVPSGTKDIIKSKSPWNHFLNIVELNDDLSKRLGEKVQQKKREEDELAEQKRKEAELDSEKELAEKVFDIVEQMPSFGPCTYEVPIYNKKGNIIGKTKKECSGGQAGLFQWLSDNIKYPVVAEENGVQGRVIVTFVIERDGSITDVRVVKSVDPSLDKEAVRVTKAMPHWIPGKKEGKPVRVKYTLHVPFRLQ